MFRRLIKLFKKDPPPKIQPRYLRKRTPTWFTCLCPKCDCNRLCRWEDGHCMECWNGIHKRKQINTNKSEDIN